MSDSKRNATNKAKRTYLLTGLIECDNCGATYVGHTSTNKKGYETRYYVCGNKYRTRSCKAKNINADEIETFVVQQLKAYLLDTDFAAMSKEIADKINGSTTDVRSEKAELNKITTQIQNGMKAILSGMEFPELEEEISRLRVRKTELEDIISVRQRENPTVDPKDIEEIFQESIRNFDDEHISEIIKYHINKIYAHIDGSYDVEIGVHIIGCGGGHNLVCATLKFKAA